MRDYPKLMLAVLVVTVPAYALTFEAGLDPRGRPVGSDFIAFWSAARMVLEGNGLAAYDLDAMSSLQLEQYPGLVGTTAWVHPPFFLMLVTPLGLLPYTAAFAVWSVLGLAVYFAALRPLLPTPAAWWLAVAFPGIWIGLGQGQTQFVTAALIGGALLRLESRPAIAGVLIGLLAMKPHLAILLPMVLVVGRHWITFASAAVTATTATVGAVLVFGWQSVQAWFVGMDVVKSGVDMGLLPVYKFVTPYTALRHLGVPERWGLVLHASAALVVVCMVWSVWRRTTDMRLRGPAVVVGTFLVTPYAADYDLVVLAFAIAWIASVGGAEGWLRGDRNLLVLAWVLPMVCAPVAALTHVPIAPLVLGALLREVWLRANSPSTQVAPTQSTAAGT